MRCSTTAYLWRGERGTITVDVSAEVTCKEDKGYFYDWCFDYVHCQERLAPHEWRDVEDALAQEWHRKMEEMEGAGHVA